ncbi:hypothetical protein C922_04221 [Plasmodium inui San Antonio 1]|uniref:DUF676 domain-containing protein n=1 Tax=Plasmodium inui San Antonio 1 TaxID=1237626 RepID=W7AJH1_9APIC|nr:hypothetical protein C922_04221 [Plasmodium inui San Antonio 1]EUD65481.1 hypothetical protein C922_04221 [Plasmodium inui San Antonio 1]
MKEKKTNYRSESIFSANRNPFEVLETIDDEKEAKRSANFFNNNKNILLNLFANPNSNNHVDSILLQKRRHLNRGTNAKKKECKKMVDKKEETSKSEPSKSEPSKGDVKTVRNRSVCANKKWIQNFCWFCSLHLLDEVLEKEIYKEKIHPHVYDLIYDENTYFDTSSVMSVPYEFARFMLTQLDSNILHDIKINNIIKEEKYLFKKFCRKYNYRKRYRKVCSGPGSGRPLSSNGGNGRSRSSRSGGSCGSGGSAYSDYSRDSSRSSGSVKSDHSLVYRSRMMNTRYSNYLNLRKELFNSDRDGGNVLDGVNRLNCRNRLGGSSQNVAKLFYNSNDLDNCDSTGLFYCRKEALPDEVSSNNNSCDTLSFDGEGRSRRETEKPSRLTNVWEALNGKGGEQISPSLSNSSSVRVALSYSQGRHRKKLSESNASSQSVWKSLMGRSGRSNGSDRNGRSGTDFSVGRIATGERKEKKKERLVSTRELRRRRFARRGVRNNVDVKGDSLFERLLKRSNSFSIHRLEHGGEATGGDIPPEEERKDRFSSRSHRIYNKYKHNLNYIKQFYYIDETKKKPFPLCLYNIIKSYGTIKQCSRCYCFFNCISCHCLECKRKSNLSLKNPHYIIFQHGLTASVHDFQNIVNPLLTKHPHLFIYITYSNQSHTFEGVDVGTERICTELNCLFKIINDKINVSMIGHSLGGILNRSVLINLYRKKVFKNKKLINFITFACPHIGVHENMAIIKLFSSYLGAHTIDDLNNKTPLLLKIASVESINILKKFENIIFYGNAQSDWLVGIRTSLILPYTLFNEELLMFIIEQSRNVPEIPINIFSVVHLYMRKKKLLFFYFYQDLNNPNYLMNRRKYQNRFLDQMLQTIISSRKLLSCSGRKKMNALMNYGGGSIAKDDGKKGKVKRKNKSPCGGSAVEGNVCEEGKLAGNVRGDSPFGGNVYGGDASSSQSRDGYSKREDSRACEEETCCNAPVQMNRRGGSIHTDAEAPVLRSTMDKPYMSDEVNVQRLPIHFRKNISTVETNQRALRDMYHSCDKLSPMNVLTIGTNEGRPPQKDKKGSLFKSHTYEDIHVERTKRREATSEMVNREKGKAGPDANANRNVDVNLITNTQCTVNKTNKMSYYDKYLCIPDNYKLVRNSIVKQSLRGMYSDEKIKSFQSCYVERSSPEGGTALQRNRHTIDRSKSSGPEKGSSIPFEEPPHSANQSDTQESSNKKKFGDYKNFEKIFFDCLKRKIINDIKTLDHNLKRKKKKTDVAPTKSFSLQNTINTLKNYSLFYLKNGTERGAVQGSTLQMNTLERSGLDGRGLQSNRRNYQPISETPLSIVPDHSSSLAEAPEPVHNVKSESCFGETKKKSNAPYSNQSNKKKEKNMLQLCEAKGEGYDYISEFFYTTSEDNEEDDANDESSGDEKSPEQSHEYVQQEECSENPKNSISTAIGAKKKWKGTTLLKGITKDDKKKYKQILFHIYTISSEELIEKFCKNPELLYYEVLFYCLNQLPIQRYSISLPLYSNAHVQIIAHPRVCSEESAAVKHFMEHLIL